MMTKLVLVRHGQTEWNVDGKFQGQSNVALTEEGIRQARELAEHFPVQKLDAIYASDLSRARVTAEIVGDYFGLPVQVTRELRELHFGDWEGLSYDEIVSGWPDALENFLQHPDRLRIPHGESFHQLQERAMLVIAKILAAHDDETVLVVAHGAILRTILTAVLHMPLEYLWSIRQFNTAVNILRYDDGNWTIELLNSTAHLSRHMREKI